MDLLGTRRTLRAFILLLLIAASFKAAPSSSAQSTVAREYQVKAVFLFNFAEFVDWPPAAFGDAQSPLIIGVLGEDPFGSYLDEAVRGEKVNNRPLVVRRFQRVEDVTACHILFVGFRDHDQLERALSGLKGRSILTVGDADDFSRLGGMIRFVMENNRIHLRINLGAAREAGLMISSKLLRPAEIVSMRRTRQ
jgi:YfiR/HmsC-like